MRKKTFIRVSIAAALCLTAQLALAQNADRNTAGPTKNQLQLRVAEPRQGATIAGSSIRVVVAYNKSAFGQGTGTKFGEPNYPQPSFDVYLDNTLKQTLKGGESNVATIDNVPPGTHKIAVVAKNLSNEIIDRQEITVTNSEGSSAASSSATTSEASSASGSQSAPPAASDSSSMGSQPSSTGSTSPTYGTGTSSMSTQSSQPAPRETTSYGSTSAAPREPSTSTSGSTKLPATASNNPRLGVLGLALLAAGLWVGRKTR